MRSFWKTIVVLGMAPIQLLDPTVVTAATPTVTLNIETQPLGDALNAFAQQTGLQLVFYSQIGDGFIAPALSGTFSPGSALQQLLANTPLSYEYVNERTIAIRLKTDETTRKISDQRDITSEQTLRLAQTSESRVAERDTQNDTRSAVERTQVNSTKTPEIFVKGSRVLNMDIKRSPDDIQPYVVFAREAIERSGFRNIEEFLKYRLTSANTSATVSQTAGGSNQSVVNLRGLGSAQTLILVDGHRIASIGIGGSAGQPDLNGIPLSAIERIEVLPTTASGIYGGSATGGVINVIMRRDYSGVETRFLYGNSFDGGGSERRVEMNAGLNLEEGKTNILLAGAYSESSDLLVRDRDFVQRGRETIMRNNPSTFEAGFTPPLGSTTNICSSFFGFCASAFGMDVPLVLNDGTVLGSSFTSVPAGYLGPSSDDGAQLAENAGQYNLALANTTQNSGGANQALLNAPLLKSLMATIRREFTPRIQAFVDLSTSRNAGSFTTNSLTGKFTLPAGAANNPFNQEITVTTPITGVDRFATSTNEDRRAVIGAIFKISDLWQAEADYTWNRTKISGSFAADNLIPDATTVVSAGVTGGGAEFNIFRDTNPSPLDYSSYIGQLSVVSPSTTTLRDATIRLSGTTPFSFPAGSPTLSFLVEHRKERLSDYSIVSPEYDITAYSRQQSIDSVYLETQLPLISSQNAFRGVKAFDLTLALRRDRYSLTGSNTVVTFVGSPPDPQVTATRELSSVDPTVGLRYQPLPDITFRASFGTGFVPPDLALLVPPFAFDTDGSVYGLQDPLRDEAIGPFRLFQGGNPNLRSEQSRSWAAGVILTPRFAPGLQVRADLIKIDKKDNVSTSIPLTQETLNNAALFPGLIVRGPRVGFTCDPDCPIIEIHGEATNVAQQTVEALDLAVDYRVETNGRGAFTLSSAATRNIRSTLRSDPTTPEYDGLGSIGALKWRMNAALTWEYQAWAVQWATRYFDSYYFLSDRSVLPNQGSAAVPTQTYHDASLTYHFDTSNRAALLNDTNIQVVITNIFNKAPPMDLSIPPLFYSSFGDPRMANYSISIRKAFH